MSAQPEKRHRVEPVLTHQQMKKFKSEVRETILTLVNTYGIDYRLQADGQHIFLYSGRRGERPMKVGAARQAKAQMNFLMPWIKEHVPQYEVPMKERKVDAVFKCAQGCKDASFVSVEEINDHYAKEHAPQEETPVERADRHAKSLIEDVFANPKAPSPAVLAEKRRKAVEAVETHTYEDEQVGAQQEGPVTSAWDESKVQWAPYLYANGTESQFFEVTTDRSKPMVLRCKAPGCAFQRVDNFRGVHLHENKHTGKSQEYAAIGGAASKAKTEALMRAPAEPEPKKVTQGDGEAIYDALQILAGLHGYVVVTSAMAEDLGKAEDDSMMITALRDEIARLEDGRDALQKELDETKAKLALIREAMSL